MMLKKSLMLVVVFAMLAALPSELPAADDIRREIQSCLRRMRRRGNQRSRAEAYEMLGYIGDPSVLSDLSESMHVHPYALRGNVVEAVGRIGGPKATRILITEIRNRYYLQGWPNEALRLLGEAMGRMDGKEKKHYKLMRNRYVKGCKYSEGKPEPEMYFCMAWYGDQKSIGALINWMKTGSPARRHLVAERLGEIGNKKADEEMCMLVDYSEDQKLRKICAISLGRRRAKLAVESLLDALADKLELEASQALGMIGDTEAVEDLKPLLKHKSAPVRLNVAFALARLGDKSGVDVAKAQLASKNKLAAAKAAATLIAAGDDAGMPKLKEAWKKLNAKERYWFINDNLAGGAWATPFLTHVSANDKYPGTRKAAKATLAKTKK